MPGYDVSAPSEGAESDDPGRACAVHLEQDEDGVWCAHAQLRPGVGAHGEGDSPEAAVADLREALEGLIGEFGVPQELTITVDVA
jgi:predicted RNase H-like HicB family nuclease